MILSEIK